jgi:hypothetical protein
MGLLGSEKGREEGEQGEVIQRDLRMPNLQRCWGNRTAVG